MTRPTIQVQVDKGTATTVAPPRLRRLRKAAPPTPQPLGIGLRAGVEVGTPGRPTVVVDIDALAVTAKPSTTSVATYARGPQGSPGPTGVSTDAGNAARLGTDGLVLVTPKITVGPTAPPNPTLHELWVDTK